MSTLLDVDQPVLLPPDDNPANDELVLLARMNGQRYSFTAMQVIDALASYLATGGTLTQPDTDDGATDAAGPLHVITEQWAWGNVPGWLASTDPIARDTYRAQAVDFAADYFGSFPQVTW
ncbi:MAG: hypothetical protein GEV09_05600 [Pseudonocardiaceae bacterium]|nr:hypothetical protein [Pseudonocardiaceae bacterium]